MINAPQRLRTWASDWTAHQLLAKHPLPVPELPAPAEPSQVSGAYTVSSGGGVAGILLAQLTSAIAPDDAQRAALDGAFTVSAGGPSVPRVPILRGQIRQFNPELKPAWTRAVLVLVLTVDEAWQRALVAPFSQFAEPAFEGELVTDLKDGSMAVLCLWNATWVSFACLRHSWWLTDAFDDLLQDASALHLARSRREPVPAVLQDRIGLPILHPLDPRHDYLDVEAGLLEDLTGQLS